MFRLFDIAPGLRNIQIVNQNVSSQGMQPINTRNSEFWMHILFCIILDRPIDPKLLPLIILHWQLNMLWINCKEWSIRWASTFVSNRNWLTSNASIFIIEKIIRWCWIGCIHSDFPNYQSSAIFNNKLNSLWRSAQNSPNTGSSVKRDYRGEQIDFRSEAISDANSEVNQKLSALSKALTDATALLKSAGLSTGRYLVTPWHD